MKKLIVNITNAERVEVDGKLKTFNTLSFVVDSDEEAQAKISELEEDGRTVVKHHCWFVK